MAATVELPEQISVLIVGAGPTGMTLALDLARRGVDCLIAESTTERPVNPRCNTTSARSMEIFRRLGIADDIRKSGLPSDYPATVKYVTRLKGEELHRLDFPSASEVLAGEGREHWPGPEPQHKIAQIFLEPLLEDVARRTSGVTIARGCRVTGLQEFDDRVEVVIETGYGSRTVSCRYLVGCDGAHSSVRRSLGIRYQGVEAIQKFVSTYVRSRELGELAAQDRAWTYWMHGRQLSALIAIDGHELWLHHVAFDPQHDTENEDPDTLLRDAVGGTVAYDTLGVVRWTGRQLVAERYQTDRVFLAGDAAHIWIPISGFGMNTGIQDAASLAWMLAAVVQGWAPASLLSAYELERKPVGEQFAQAIGVTAKRSLAPVSADIHLAGPVGERARHELSERLRETESARYSPDGFSFGYHYSSSPIVIGAEERPPVEMGSFERKARVGYRMPHTWLADGRSTLDMCGPGFTIFRTDASVDVDAWVVAAREMGVPLGIADIPRDWPDRYPEALILTRPDQHVAWMGSGHTNPSDVLRTVTGRHVVDRDQAHSSS